MCICWGGMHSSPLSGLCTVHLPTSVPTSGSIVVCKKWHWHWHLQLLHQSAKDYKMKEGGGWEGGELMKDVTM